jgi:hypothetical protein
MVTEANLQTGYKRADVLFADARGLVLIVAHLLEG